MKKKKLFLICSFVLFCSLIYFSFPQLKHLVFLRKVTPITKVLSSIPPSDQATLEHFFRYLLVHERFAYTLFGDKPMALCICPELLDNSYDDTSRYLTKKDWQTWEKYKKLIPSHNFALRKLPNDKKEETCILLINKKQFLKTVNKRIKLFRTVLSTDISAQQLLNIFLTHPKPFKKGLKNRSILEGILFGYGKTNSCLYRRKKTIEKALIATYSKPYLRPRDPFQTLEEELQHLTHQLRPFSQKDNSLMRLPTFLADPTTEETKTLKKKYQHQRDHFLPFLTQDNFLELTLAKLTSR